MIVLGPLDACKTHLVISFDDYAPHFMNDLLDTGRRGGKRGRHRHHEGLRLSDRMA